MRAGQRFFRRALVALGAASLMHGTEAQVQIRPPDRPTARSDVLTRPRVALILVTQAPEASTRASLAHADSEALSERLRDIGFDVRTIGPASRPELVRSLRDAAAGVPIGADVAVLALGQVVGATDDIFLIPAGQPLDVTVQGHRLDGEAIRLGDVLRRLADRRPRELVAVLDECRSVHAAPCPLDAAVGASGASLVAVERTDLRGSGRPVAALPSLREQLLRATAQEDQSFLTFYEALRAGLDGTDMSAFASSRLSASFSFLPSGYFRGLRTECNRVDPSVEAIAIRSLALDPLIRACQEALAAYPYADFFKTQLAAAREQLAFQRGVATCDRLAAADYRTRYPAGRFRSLIDEHGGDCERRDQDRRRETEQQNEMRQQDEARRRDREEARRRDLEEEAAYRRAVASCGARPEAAGYAARYPGGRYRPAVDTFVRGCEAADRQREQEQREAALRQEEEEAAYRRAIASCGARLEAAGYMARYPGGRYRAVVETFVRGCEAADRQREQDQTRRRTVSSRTGWTATYSPSLLHVEAGENDSLSPLGLYTTYLKPNSATDGKVDFFIQTGENKECQPAEAWAQRVLTRNRPQISARQAVMIAGQPGYFQEGPSFKGDPDASFMDVIIIPRQDSNMFVHVGVQFPTRDRSRWRDEFIRVLNTLQVGATGVVRGHCGG